MFGGITLLDVAQSLLLHAREVSAMAMRAAPTSPEYAAALLDEAKGASAAASNIMRDHMSDRDEMAERIAARTEADWVERYNARWRTTHGREAPEGSAALAWAARPFGQTPEQAADADTLEEGGTDG